MGDRKFKFEPSEQFDIKPPITFTEFKKELNPSASRESDIISLSQSAFKLSSSDTGELHSKDNALTSIFLTSDATQDLVPQECQPDDIKPPIPLTVEFKQELDPWSSTESSIDNLDQSTFKLSPTDELDSKDNFVSSISLFKETREEQCCRESVYHSDQHAPGCLKDQVKDGDYLIKKELPFLINSLGSDHPIVIKSQVDDLVSRNVHLENDKTDKPIHEHELFSKELTCKMCINEEDSYSHEKTSNSNAFKCNECSKCFPRNYNLQRHIKTHRGEKPFKCEECSKCFTQHGTLVGHMRIHTGIKPFKCNICVKGFAHSGNLQRHIKTHRIEKPFICNKCGNCFSKGRYLQNHMRRIHNEIRR